MPEMQGKLLTVYIYTVILNRSQEMNTAAHGAARRIIRMKKKLLALALALCLLGLALAGCGN